jgi:hypothetical protein
MSTVVKVVAPKFSKVTEGVMVPGQIFPEGELTELIPASTCPKPCRTEINKEKRSICFIIENRENREFFNSLYYY